LFSMSPVTILTELLQLNSESKICCSTFVRLSDCTLLCTLTSKPSTCASHSSAHVILLINTPVGWNLHPLKWMCLIWWIQTAEVHGYWERFHTSVPRTNGLSWRSNQLPEVESVYGRYFLADGKGCLCSQASWHCTSLKWTCAEEHPVELTRSVVPKLCAAAPWGTAIYSTRPANYDLFIQWLCVSFTFLT
jgi:hypothetical protein